MSITLIILYFISKSIKFRATGELVIIPYLVMRYMYSNRDHQVLLRALQK